MARKKGKKMSDADRMRKSIWDILTMMAQFVRRDGGGVDLLESAVKKAKEFANDNSVTITDGGAELMGKFALQYAEDQFDGCRKRNKSNLDELQRRFSSLAGKLAALHTSLSFGPQDITSFLRDATLREEGFKPTTTYDDKLIQELIDTLHVAINGMREAEPVL